LENVLCNLNVYQHFLGRLETILQLRTTSSANNGYNAHLVTSFLLQ